MAASATCASLKLAGASCPVSSPNERPSTRPRQPAGYAGRHAALPMSTKAAFFGGASSTALACWTRTLPSKRHQQQQQVCRADARRNINDGLSDASYNAKQAGKDISRAAEDAYDSVTEPSSFDKTVELLTTLFPVWVLIGTFVGLAKPSAVTWLGSDLFTLMLGLLMLSMGLTLTVDDFRQILRNPWTVGVGFLAQYFIKPLLGYCISLALGLSAPLATGLILVSCCPGGQASNVATYIAHGNVALSVAMTTCSTIGAILMTPLLTKTLAGQLVPVDAKGLAISTFQVVLVPTVLGVVLHEWFPRVTKAINKVTPLIGVIIVTLLCASPIGQVADVLKTQGMQLLWPVMALHAFAFGLGYIISKFSGFGEKTSRTVSIECGMQSSALGFLLAQKHFTNPLVAVPSAVSVVCMALGGALLAVIWRNMPISSMDKDDFKAA